MSVPSRSRFFTNIRAKMFRHDILKVLLKGPDAKVVIIINCRHTSRPIPHLILLITEPDDENILTPQQSIVSLLSDFYRF